MYINLQCNVVHTVSTIYLNCISRDQLKKLTVNVYSTAIYLMFTVLQYTQCVQYCNIFNVYSTAIYSMCTVL